jgi:hypothetical protein
MSRFYLKGAIMRKNTSILRYKQTPGKPHKPPSHAPLAKLKGLLLPAYKFIPETIAWLLFSRCYRYWRPIFGGGVAPQIDLLQEFRPIGGSGNNRESPDLDLEETPLTSAAINILVPPVDPVFT